MVFVSDDASEVHEDVYAYMLRLDKPFDTPEDVQETLSLAHTPVCMNGDEVSLYSFPQCKGNRVVILDPAGKDAVLEWASRHKAIYSPVLHELGVEEYKYFMSKAQQVTYPCPYFLSILPADDSVLHEVRSLFPNTSLNLRPATIRGVAPNDIAVFGLSEPYVTSDALEQSEPITKPKISSTAKLRPVHDVIHRIKWDIDFDLTDYIIVYLDRFAGETRIKLDEWKCDVSDEDFVPMHRVIRILRESDGVAMWDRSARVDLVFGSGASAEPDADKAVTGSALMIDHLDDAFVLWRHLPENTVAVPCTMQYTDGEGGIEKGRVFVWSHGRARLR